MHIDKLLPHIIRRKSIKTLSKIAGLGYLVIFITGIYANFFVLESMIVPGDPATTAENIILGQMKFRMGIISFIIMVIFDVFLAWALYVLLEPANRHLSLLSAWLRLVNAALFGIAVYNLLMIVTMTNPGLYRDILTAGQLQVRVQVFLDAFNLTWLLGLVFFGLHLFVLAYLIIKSGYIPKILGILLAVAAAGYLIDSFANFILRDYNNYKDIFLMIVVIPGIIGELSFTVWLLLKGVNDTGNEVSI